MQVFYLILFKRAQHKYSGYSRIIALNTTISCRVHLGLTHGTTSRQDAVLFFGHMDVRV